MQIEDSAHSEYHVFISYRVAPEKDLAKTLYDNLSQLVIPETGQRLRVYLDQVRLKDGERWDVSIRTECSPCFSGRKKLMV